MHAVVYLNKPCEKLGDEPKTRAKLRAQVELSLSHMGKYPEYVKP